jgi:hypothetical protein
VRAAGRGAFEELGDFSASVGGTSFRAAIFTRTILRAEFGDPFS